MINTLLAALLILSTIGTVLAAFLELLSGGSASGSHNSTRDFVPFMALCLILAVASAVALIWRKWGRRMVATAKMAIESAPAAENAPPAYSWTCLVCDTANPPGSGACAGCGSSPFLSSTQIAQARQRHMDGRAG
ncbi:hypothetical protein AACH06_29535 [Ideonella sp. DXS29W]|uniref:RanBP2-type domain-containing protein n=1 Tax=Ideonella lacteola TaxID=2984193 RepID=A0ABU9C2R9_9BURK